MKILQVAVIVLVALLAACDRPSTDPVDKAAFEAFLTLKRIPLNDEARYQRMLEAYGRRQALAEAIADSERLDPVMIDAEVDEFRKQLLISRYFEGYLKDAVSEEGIQNFYRQNIDQYRTRRVRVAHILFRVAPRMGEPERQALLTAAREAYSQINAGEVFAEVAKARSQDKVSAAKGGELGWINEGAVSKEFSAKAFAMTAGEISDPFLTPFGYHILTVLEAPQEVTKPLESVKGDLRYQLRHESKRAEMERLLDSVGYVAE